MKFSARVNLVNNSTSKLRAFASLSIDEVITIEGFKIFDGPKGPFVKPPSHAGKTPNEKGETSWYDDVTWTEVAVEEGQPREQGPLELAAYSAILETYSRVKGGNSRQAAAKANAKAAVQEDMPF